MKSKLLILLLLCLVASYQFALTRNDLKERNFSGLLLENIESLAMGEHGNIDETLEPYMELSSYEVWFPDVERSTRIPCCKSCSSQYSGCAKGLDRCI